VYKTAQSTFSTYHFIQSVAKHLVVHFALPGHGLGQAKPKPVAFSPSQARTPLKFIQYSHILPFYIDTPSTFPFVVFLNSVVITDEAMDLDCTEVCLRVTL
jgi:hypothetical protein